MAGSHPTVVGPYEIVRPLGHGRLGDLFFAVDPMLDREVALRLLPELSGDIRARFAGDARHRARLQHPAIAPIYMVGEHQGRLYFARPFIPGRTLDEVVAAKTVVPLGRRVEWMAVLCDALAYAYGVGHARLALQLSEIVISKEGLPTLLDIGLPLVIEDTAADRSPSYPSPEELRGWASDQRSDIFVAGAVLHELITYEKPFGDGSDAEIHARIAVGELRFRTDAMVPALAAIVMKVLQPDPAERHQTFQELASDLRRALRLLDDAGSLESLEPKPPSARPPSSLPSRIDTARLAQRRAELIEQYTARSREALQHDKYDEAMELAEQAALLDATDPGVLELLRLIEAARLATDAARLVADAQRSFEKGAMADAASIIVNALALCPSHADAHRLRAMIEEARRQQQARARSSELGGQALESLPSPAEVEEGRRIDDNVRFTLYRPPVMVPEHWYPLLLFTHLSDRRPDAAPGEIHPEARVEAEAAQKLGAAVAAFPRIVQEAGVGIPHEALVRIKPSVAGLVFNPPEYSFLWIESVHRADFKVRASSSLDGRTVRGTIEVHVGVIPVALITVAIPIDSRAPMAGATAQEVVRPYRRIFASYSHKDTAIVRQFENYARGLGDSYMRDVIDLRAGELWDDRLVTMIDDADVFQLFWSTNSMRSPFVRREWEHALTVDKSNFVRPLYWESPFPEGEGLPPPQLKARHFASVAVAEGHDTTELDRGAAHDTRPGSPSTGAKAGLALEVVSSGGQPPPVTRKGFGAAGGTVGRTKNCDLVLPDNNVSRTHARISCENATWYIEDTSTNGIFLNSPLNRLERGRRYPLNAGDRLLINPYELQVSIVTDRVPTVPSPAEMTGHVFVPDDYDPLSLDAGVLAPPPLPARAAPRPPAPPAPRSVPRPSDQHERPARGDAGARARAEAEAEERRRQAEEARRPPQTLQVPEHMDRPRVAASPPPASPPPVSPPRPASPAPTSPARPVRTLLILAVAALVIVVFALFALLFTRC